MSQPIKRISLPYRPIRPAPKGEKGPASSFDKIERRQQQEVNRLLPDKLATPFLGDGFDQINVDGTIYLDSPERYTHRTLEAGEQSYRLPVPMLCERYPPGQGPLVPNNSPVSDFEFDKGEEEGDGYKDDVTKEEKMKDLAYVADGKNVLKRKTNIPLINSIGSGKCNEQLHLFKQSNHQYDVWREREKLHRKTATEVNWFTATRRKQVKVNLPTTYTSRDEIKEDNAETFVDSDKDTDSEGGVVIPPESTWLA